MDQTYLIILRLFHIVTGVFWAGSTIYLARFVIPAAKALGPEGGRFMQQLTMTNNLPAAMLGAGTLNILSGILLFWELSGGFQSAWFSSHYGMTLSIGGTTGLIAYIIGVTMNRPAGMRMAALSKAIAASGGVPTPEQAQQVQDARNKLISATNRIAGLLVITVIAMAIARYT
ncbi:MAG: hypothetical protein H7Y00_08930 [Fimbriimonadaceae bacterium]|nr:hypothetical protein [Chitinophagales bacterium]